MSGYLYYRCTMFNPAFTWLLVILFGLSFGCSETFDFTISMQVTGPRIAASMFSILMAIAYVGIGIGLAPGSSLPEAAGYRWMFTIAAALILLAPPLLAVIFQPRPVRQSSVAYSL